MGADGYEVALAHDRRLTGESSLDVEEEVKERLRALGYIDG